MSLSEQLLEYHRAQGEWLNSGATTKIEWRSEEGKPYKIENAGRRLRELENDRKLAVKYIAGVAHYKYIPSYARHLYRTAEERKLKDSEKMWTDEVELKFLLERYKPR